MNVTARKILHRPLLTEKTNRIRESKNRVVFEVTQSARKPEIKTAIEQTFKVRVLSLNTLIVRGKKRQVGRTVGRRPNWKKVIATLRPDDKIELFEGV